MGFSLIFCPFVTCRHWVHCRLKNSFSLSPFFFTLFLLFILYIEHCFWRDGAAGGLFVYLCVCLLAALCLPLMFFFCGLVFAAPVLLLAIAPTWAGRAGCMVHAETRCLSAFTYGRQGQCSGCCGRFSCS